MTAITDQQFYQFCRANLDLRIERTVIGELLVMPPSSERMGKASAKLINRLNTWNCQTQMGRVFSSSTKFNLPKGGDRSSDAAWVKLECWESLSVEGQEQFPPICPDFVVELRSHTASLNSLQAKMKEYLASGLRLGWLIDPQNRRVEIYRLGQEVEVLQSPAMLLGKDVLPGFILELQGIFGSS